MNLINASVLITGGSDGIGLGLATRYLKAGCKVLVTGRNPEKLNRVAQQYPGILTFVNDISIPDERERLAEYVVKTLPDINILINNAGIQRRVSLAADTAGWDERQSEIDILLSAPIHLNHLLIPQLLSHKKKAAIVNVTSGGAFIPQVFAPVYSACKAALHSYTVNLRFALENTDCLVKELIPPAVATSINGTGGSHGMNVDEFCDAVFPQLASDDFLEIGFGPTANLSVEISGMPVEKMFQTLSSRFPVDRY